MQLGKYLCRFGRVAYNSLEEGASLNIRNAFVRENMMEVNRRFMLLDCEPMEQLSIRLKRQKSPDFVIIDSFQYTGMTFQQYVKLKEKHRNKMLIFISHSTGNLPKGKAAQSVMFDVMQKIFINGYRAFSKGRFNGPKGTIDIWPERAAIFHGEINNTQYPNS
jgi:hypothetical protein